MSVDGNGGQCTSEYSEFKVLLDEPAEILGLGFDGYATALAEMITYSRADFAVAIFGGWGSGKTTLMRAINKILDDDENIVPVWFTAWRYEKEPHLIVPLLDVLRETLDAQAGAPSGWAHQAAAAFARAGRAFLAGLSLSGSLPGVQLALDPGKMIEKFQSDDGEPGRLSFYHAGFTMLRDAIRGLSAGGTRRMVIFVDDLDRCLPDNALSVLESMKLFFDVEGCVFVVGLDQEIADKAVAVKFGPSIDPTDRTDISSSDYLKKIFPISFTLPRVSGRELPDYLAAIEKNSDFGEAQRADFKNVLSHFRALQGEDAFNPREIKRLINTYVLQLKILSWRLGDSLNPNVVLALVLMNFRPDWREFYDLLSKDPQLFQSTMQEALNQAGSAEPVYVSGTKVALPFGLPEYLNGRARSVLDAGDLQLYVSAAESTWSTDPWVLDARIMVSKLRRSIDALSSADPEAITQISSEIERLSNLVITRRKQSGRPRITSKRSELLMVKLRDILPPLLKGEDEQFSETAGEWTKKAVPLLDELDTELQTLQRYINVGAY